MQEQITESFARLTNTMIMAKKDRAESFLRQTSPSCRANLHLNLNWITVASTLSNMMSISEYFIPPISTGIRCPMCGMRTSLQIWCSASDSQNSHASSDTELSVSCVLISMYCIHFKNNYSIQGINETIYNMEWKELETSSTTVCKRT